MRLAITVIAGIMLATAVSSLQAQTKPAPAPAPKPAAKQAAAPPAAQVAAAAPQASKPAPKPAPKAAAKPAAAPAAKPAGSGAPAESETKVARRDPFESLTSRQEAAARAGANLPPGKAGLQVGTLRLDGIVRAPNGMIAVVTN